MRRGGTTGGGSECFDGRRAAGGDQLTTEDLLSVSWTGGDVARDDDHDYSMHHPTRPQC